MNALDSLRPTVLPALLYLLVWPIFWLLPARRGGAAPAFFIVSGLVFVTLVDGPLLALGVGAAIVLAYLLIERVARMEDGRLSRQIAFAALLIGLHAAYFGCFFLPVPEAYRIYVPRPADQAPVMILFSGIALTFFRVVSFAHDRCAGRVTDARLRDYLAYVMFFPQFRHGPIERFATLAPQLQDARHVWQPRDAAVGLLRILATYAALVLAVLVILLVGRFAGIVERHPDVLAAVGTPSALTLPDVMVLVHLPALLLYAVEWASAALQLGVARVFGVHGAENFDRVWLARDPVDFWRRWQTTLGAWIRDYAFWPMARQTRSRTAAIVLAFVYCGLLHGPQLRCLVWGLYNGFSVALAAWLLGRFGRGTRREAPGGLPALIRSGLARAALFIWLSVGVTILLDPEWCGLWLLWRYLTLLAALVGLNA